MWIQKELSLSQKSRGFHLVTDEILAQLPEIQSLSVGLLHLFIQHTSASIAICENADPTVRSDMEAHFNHFVPERAPYYQHILEGSDDMPAHIKSVTVGTDLAIPIGGGVLKLGVWQGIYLGEHRNYGGRRHIVATIQGQSGSA